MIGDSTEVTSGLGRVFLGYHFQPPGDTPLHVADPAVQELEKGAPGPRLGTDTMAPARAAPVGLQGPQVRLVPAQKTVNNYLAKCARLYEQGADADRIGRYRQHWGCVKSLSSSDFARTKVHLEPPKALYILPNDLKMTF